MIRTGDRAVSDPAVGDIYKTARKLEFRERRPAAALKLYMKCLKNNPREESRPYIYHAVARCYFKWKKFPQAHRYYYEMTHTYARRVKQDRALYFLALRQTALSNRLRGDAKGALETYLDLYEEVLGYEAVEKSDRFEFFKNEALAYLNRHIKDQDEEETRFSRALAIDRLDPASRLDISLRWRYFDIESDDYDGAAGTDGTPAGESRFLRLRELHAFSDEKTRFYREVKETHPWEKPPSLEKTRQCPGGARNPTFEKGDLGHPLRYSLSECGSLSGRIRPCFLWVFDLFRFCQKPYYPPGIQGKPGASPPGTGGLRPGWNEGSGTADTGGSGSGGIGSLPLPV
jgi:hypothetical protein